MDCPNFKLKNSTVHRRLFIAFSDLAILVALKNQAMTGYGINKYFMKKIGNTASTSTIYSTLAKTERESLIKCVNKKNGRVYILTDQGKKIIEDIKETGEESKQFLDNF